MRRFWWSGIAVVALSVASVFVYLYPMPQKTQRLSGVSSRYITIGTTTLTVEVESTDDARGLGLSGRSGLAPGTGMLFVFDRPGEHGFWMKDMLFSIDIIFADAQGVVLTVASNLSPNTFPQVFYPAHPAQYVLEVPAGFAKEHGVAVGTKIVLQ